jgi:hypothetical protein
MDFFHLETEENYRWARLVGQTFSRNKICHAYMSMTCKVQVSLVFLLNHSHMKSCLFIDKTTNKIMVKAN